LINGLGELIERGIYDSPEAESLLAVLGDEIGQHFTLEEGCMLRHACPMAQKNKEEHEQLERGYLDFISGFSETKSLESLSAFHRSAEGWLLEHICFVDIHLWSCLGHAAKA